MYLRKMGSVSLLTREGEVEISKRIEDGEKKVLEAVLHSSMAIKEIIQIGAAKVILTGGAVARNVFWQVFGVADFGTTAHMEGVVLSQTSITLKTGASANGRLLAQTAVTLAGNTVVQP